VRPRRLEPGDSFTWRFKTKDYWEAVRVPGQIRTVEQLMALHEPWVTSDASQVLYLMESHGAQTSVDEEGLIVVEIDDGKLDEINTELARLGCRVSNELLHTL
jgi:hypothetical protein